MVEKTKRKKEIDPMNKFNSDIEADQKRRDSRENIIGALCLVAIALLIGTAILELLNDEAYRKTQAIISEGGR